MKILVERDAIRQYDKCLLTLFAKHWSALDAGREISTTCEVDWAIEKILAFREEYEERYGGPLSEFGGTTMFKERYFSETYALLMRIRSRPLAGILARSVAGHRLPQELVDSIQDFICDDAELRRVVGDILSRPDPYRS